MLSNNARFTARRVGTTGHEILDPSGNVIAWAIDEVWAAMFVALFNWSSKTNWRLTCRGLCDDTNMIVAANDCRNWWHIRRKLGLTANASDPVGSDSMEVKRQDGGM